MTDFLINFGSNASFVIAQMRALEAQALRTQQVINQTNAASARTAAAGGGPAALGGLSAASVGAVSPQVDRLTRSLGGLQSQMRAVSAIGLAPTLAQTRREATLLQQIVAAGGPAFGSYKTGILQATGAMGGISPAAQASARDLISQRAALDSTSAAFQRHVGRIQETVLVYAALAAAAAGVTSAVSLASTIDTESRRLEAVLGLNQQQGRDFVGGIFDTAITTATPVEDLLSESDLIASAFAGITDAAEKQRLSLALLNDVGKVTTVTQRDVATETQNLIAIMQLGGLSVDQLGVALGQVTAAGNNSSTSIAAILDALNIAIPGAKLAGVTIEQLIALTGLFRAETQRSGSEIGNTFKTLFQTITQPEAENNISDLTNGLVELRDSAGNLRPALEILLEIKTLIDSGAIDPGRLNDIFKAFAPPLNPGAAKDIAIIFDLLDQLPAALREVESTGGGALDALVAKLNAALGPQFRILIEEIKQGFNDLFGQSIVDAGQGLIDFMRTLGAVLHALPPELVVAVGQLLALGAAIKGVMFVGSAFLSLVGFGGIGKAAAEGAKGVGILAGSVAALQAALLRALPLAIALAAINVTGNIFEDVDKAAALEDVGIPEAQREFAVTASREARFGRGPDEFNFSANLLQESGIGPIQAENLNRLATAILQMRQAGSSTAESEKAMADAIRDADGAIQDQLVSIEDIIAASGGAVEANSAQADEMERLIESYLRGAEAAGSMTEAQRLEAETASLLEVTRAAQAADLEDLAERYRTGKITADEFAQGQQIVAQSADLAAQLVAIAGEKLGEYPLFAAAAEEGQEKLTEKVYEMIVASGGSIGAISGLIGQLANLAGANAAVAASLAANPLIVRIGTARVGTEGRASIAVNGQRRRVAPGFVDAAQGINPSADAQRQIQAILDSINNLVGGAGLGTPAFGNIPSIGSGGRSGSGAAGRRATLFDIEDLPADQLARAIAIARELQGDIPGANKEAKDEVLNIIKDAEFLRQVKGLDDALLRKAIEELTDIEKARLEEERRRNSTNEILRNLQVNAGSLGALISAPTLFGVGGSIPAGLNLDPERGNFTVNVPIELKGLEPSKLQEIVFQVVRDAIRDGLRLQGAA